MYNVYFRPNGNGNSDWPSEYFYLSRKGDITEAPTDAPTAAPTAPPTDAPTSVPTEAPTQPVTDAPEESYRIGDADGDGEVSIMDVTKIQKVLATLEFDTDGKISIRGKVTLDDEDMNIMDATAIQKYLATLPVSDCRPINTITTY